MALSRAYTSTKAANVAITANHFSKITEATDPAVLVSVRKVPD